MRRVVITTFVLVTSFACASAPPPPPPPAHPRYLHARSDLRACQFYLRQGAEEENVSRRLHEADVELEAAVREIDHAAFLDQKNLDEHPRTDAGLDRPGRFRRMVELLRAARNDISLEEDNPAAAGWRDRAYRRIDNALGHVHRAAIDLRIDHDLGF